MSKRRYVRTNNKPLLDALQRPGDVVFVPYELDRYAQTMANLHQIAKRLDVVIETSVYVGVRQDDLEAFPLIKVERAE